MTTDTPLMERLTRALERLRPSERKVAERVLRDPAGERGVSMAAVAGAAGVSEPTVMRFCTGLGFDGFQSFKYPLAGPRATGIPGTPWATRPDAPVDAVGEKIFDKPLSTLARPRRFLDADAV